MQIDYTCDNGRDMYARVKCRCPSEFPNLAEIGCTYTLRLVGYNDDNFFDNVHREPRQGKCRCGREYTFQWKPEHVEFSWNDEAGK